MKLGLKISVFQTYVAILVEELAQMGKVAENAYIVHAIHHGMERVLELQ